MKNFFTIILFLLIFSPLKSKELENCKWKNESGTPCLTIFSAPNTSKITESALGKTVITKKQIIDSGYEDVRSVLEFNRGHFKNSINIPLDLLSKNIDILKKESKPVVVVCSHGIRAASACTILKKNQIDCINGGSWNNLK